MSQIRSLRRCHADMDMRFPIYDQTLPGCHFNRSFHGIKTVGRIILGRLDHVIPRLIQRSNHRYDRSVFDLVLGNGLVQTLQHIIAFSQMKQNNVSCFPDMKCVHFVPSCFMKPLLCFFVSVIFPEFVSGELSETK